jgi:heptaprenyl diphosphate synthase
MHSKSYRIVILSLYVALALIFSYIESFIPLPMPIPGAKLGLTNIITLISLLTLGWPLTLLVVISRIFLTGFIFGSLSSIFYSLSGGLLSLLVMTLLLLFKKNKPSLLFISIFGAVSHNLGQVLMAGLILENVNIILYYSPPLMLLAIPTGLFVGLITKELMRLLNKTTIFKRLNPSDNKIQ